MNDKLERRYLTGELRADENGGKRRLTGYAARWNKLSENLGGFRERLAPNCFADSLRRKPDVALLHAHDAASVLARCTNGSLAISEDSRGLRFSATLPQTTLGADVYANVKSGLIAGMSFAMTPTDDAWEDGRDPDTGSNIPIRTVRTATLYEISAVTFPAYPQTDVSARQRALFPAGFPDELRSRLALRDMEDDGEDDPEPCECPCAGCKDGDCAECANADCDDETCERDGCPNAARSLRKLQEIRSVDAATARKLQHHGRSITRIIDGLPEADRANVWQAVMHQAAEKFGVASGYYAGDDEDDEDRDLRRRARLLGHGLTI